mgnify:CR=1 FL=1
MAEDDDDAPLASGDIAMPRNLENMSIAEIEHYITQLNSEIERCRAEIEHKRKQQEAAASIFKQ